MSSRLRHMGGMVAWLGAVIVMAAGARGDEVLQTKISGVTVYAGWARVVRTGQRSLQPGLTRVVLAGLPAWVDAESVTAAVDGPEGVQLLAARGTASSVSPRSKEDLKRAEAAVTEVQDRISDVRAEQQAIQAAQKYLDQLMPWRLDKLPAESSTRPVTAAELKEVNDYLQQARLEAVKRNGELTRQQRSLEQELKEKERERDKVKRLQHQDAIDVTLDVFAAAAAEAKISVSYLICGASWYPEHSVVAAEDGASAQLRTQAVVQQATGENWEAATVSLSALHPGATHQRPVLGSWRLTTDPKSKGATPPERLPAHYEARLTPLKEAWTQVVAADDEETRKAHRRVAENLCLAQAVRRQVEVRGATPEVAVKGTHTIASDGTATPLAVSEAALQTQRRYRLAPAVSPVAFAVAETRNSAAVPLLPGPVNLRRDGQLVGRSSLDFVAPGERFDLELGPDSRFRVSRHVDPASSQLLRIGGNNRLTVAYSLAVDSEIKGEVPVVVTDQLPQGAGVSLLRSQPRAELSANGVLSWETSVTGGTTRELMFAFQIEYPEGQASAALQSLVRQVTHLD